MAKEQKEPRPLTQVQIDFYTKAASGFRDYCESTRCPKCGKILMTSK